MYEQRRRHRTDVILTSRLPVSVRAVLAEVIPRLDSCDGAMIVKTARRQGVDPQLVLGVLQWMVTGFGVPLLVVDDDNVTTATDFVDDNDDEDRPTRVDSYTSIEQVQQDQDESIITESTADRIRDALNQQPRVSSVLVGHKIDADEDYKETLNEIVKENDTWYGLAIDSRDVGDIEDVSDWANEDGRMKLFVAQTNDDDWLADDPFDDGDSFGFFNQGEDHKRTAVVYHDSDDEALDFAWLANRLSFELDLQSAPWDGHRLRAVQPYKAPVSDDQRKNALDGEDGGSNINLMLPYGPYDRVMDPGVTVEGDGRPIYELLTKDWFKFRLEDRIARAKVQSSDRGEKIPLGNEGISILRPLVEGLIEKGVEAGHFVEDQWEVEFHPPNSQDIAERRIRAEGYVQLAISARKFDLTFNFQHDPVN